MVMNTPLLRILGRLGLVALILVALFTATARLLLPLLGERYQAEIREAATQSLGMTVEIERLDARWFGFGPQLRLHGVRMGHLALEEVRIDLAPLDSLLQARPVLSSVTLVRAKLRVLRDENDRLRLLDLSQVPESNASQHPAGLLLERLPLGIGFMDSEFLLQSAKNPLPLHLVHSDLSFRRKGDGFNAWGRLHLAGSEDSEIKAVARIRGPLDDPGLWVGRLYLKTQALGLEEFLQPVLDPEQLQLKGQLEMEVWAKINEGRLEHLEGGLDLQGLNILRFFAGQEIRSYGLNRLQGQLRWKSDHNGWRLQLANLGLERNQTRWPVTAISLKSKTDGEGKEQLEGAAAFIRLEDILSLARLFPANENDKLLRLVQQLRPAGDLHGLVLEAHLGGDEVRWAMDGEARNIRTNAWERVPAIDSISGRFIANQGGGQIKLDDSDIRIDFADGFFGAPLKLTGLKGEFQWQRHPQGWQIASQLLSLNTADFASQSRFSLSLPDEGLAHLALMANLGEAKATAIGRYLPLGVLKPPVAKWLQEAPQDGRIKGGSLDLIGPLADFPFDKRPTGRFNARFDLEGLALDYHKGLPPLKEARGQLEFHNNSLKADIQSATIAKGQVKGAQVRIPQLFPSVPLEIEGEVQGALFENIKDLAQTSLATYLGEVADQLEGDGEAQLRLQLKLPLRPDHPKASIKGQLQLQGNRVDLPKWQLQLNDAQGLLEFDEGGFSAREIKARALDSAIRVEIRTPDRGQRRTQIISSGHLPIQALAKRRLGLELPLLQGSTDWRLEVEIPHKGQEPKTQPLLRLSSDLKGIGILLPAPFGKTAAATRPLSLEIQPTAKEDGPTEVVASLGKDIKARMELSRDDKGLQLERALVCLGGAEAERPSLPGFSLTGQLAELQLDALLDALGNKGQVKPGHWPNLDLELGQILYRGMRISNLHIRGGPRGQNWVGNLSGDDIKGQVQIPGDLKEKPIELALDSLVLKPRTEGPSQAPPSPLNPKGLPGLSLRANHLIMNKEDLGRLDIQARPDAQGLNISQLRVNSEWFSLEGQGNWQGGKTGASTQASLKLQVTDLGRLQKALGDTPDIARSGAVLEGKLGWPGSPLDFGRLELTGSLSLKVGKGSLLEVEPGAGRIFGLLNLGSIHRRLSLDFTDFLGKGFAFDKIEGDVELRQGNALTNNLALAAPGGDLKFYGRTGLRKRDIDQVVELYPEVTGTLASAGGFVAGPVVGVGLFIANKVIGKQLNKIVKVRYRVQGDWKDPKVSRILDNAKPNIPDMDSLPVKPPPAPKHKPPSFLDP